MDSKSHWEQVYASNPVEKLGWYEPHLGTSVDWITGLHLASDAPIIDIGGGACTLVDDLIAAGYRDISVLDISGQALSCAQARLGATAQSVTWIQGDVTSIDLPPQRYELWHDRAAFHFLTDRDRQIRYRHNLLQALKPGGHVIMGVFSLAAPSQCSGLPVQRYTAEQLAAALGDEFVLKREHEQLHITPDATRQMYLYCEFDRVA